MTSYTGFEKTSHALGNILSNIYRFKLKMAAKCMAGLGNTHAVELVDSALRFLVVYLSSLCHYKPGIFSMSSYMHEDYIYR